MRPYKFEKFESVASPLLEEASPFNPSLHKFERVATHEIPARFRRQPPRFGGARSLGPMLLRLRRLLATEPFSEPISGAVAAWRKVRGGGVRFISASWSASAMEPGGARGVGFETENTPDVHLKVARFSQNTLQFIGTAKIEQPKYANL